MSFTAQSMLGNQVLVTGTDTQGNTGRTTVDSTEWDNLKAQKNVSAAEADFDKVVADLFKPVVEAAEKVRAAAKGPQPTDALSYVVLQEEVKGVEHVPAQIVELSRDSIILRCIEEGDTSRLVWLSDTELGVLAV
jgi:hypothetical protein